MTQHADPSSFVIEVPEGVQIRDPATGRIAITGETFARAGFWGRRLAAGEVKELQEPSSKPTATAQPSKSRAPRES